MAVLAPMPSVSERMAMTREAGLLHQLPKRETQVLEKIVGDGLPARRPDLVLDRRGASNLDAGSARRGLRRHAGRAACRPPRLLQTRPALRRVHGRRGAFGRAIAGRGKKFMSRFIQGSPGNNRFRLRECGGWRPPGGPIVRSRWPRLCAPWRSACSTWRGGCSRLRATPT